MWAVNIFVSRMVKSRLRRLINTGQGQTNKLVLAGFDSHCSGSDLSCSRCRDLLAKGSMADMMASCTAGHTQLHNCDQ